MVSPSKWKQLNKQTRTNKRVWNNAIQGMDNSFIPRKKLIQHIIGNGIQCMDGDGNLSAQPGQQVEVNGLLLNSALSLVKLITTSTQISMSFNVMMPMLLWIVMVCFSCYDINVFRWPWPWQLDSTKTHLLRTSSAMGWRNRTKWYHEP